jgi:hypothetical protein
MAIRETIAQFSQQLRRERNVEIRVRMGLNTGLVVVGTIGDNLAMDYTAFGYTTHEAAHLEQVAEPGTILLSNATHRLVQRDVKVEVVEPLWLKGKSEPITAYRLVAFQAPDTGPIHALSAFIGRERELATLRDLLNEVERGRGQIRGHRWGAWRGKVTTAVRISP